MYYELYLDSYFFLNFILNYFALVQTERMLMCQKKRGIRVVVAALGAVLSCIFILIPYIAPMFKWILGILLTGSTMVFAVFSGKVRGRYRLAMLTFYGASFLLGGVLICIQNWRRAISGKNLMLWEILFISVLLSKLLQRMMNGYKKRQKQSIFEVCLQAGDKSICLQALLDTGNSLREPFSQRPVCVVEKNIMEKLLGQEWMREHPEKRKIIPYHSIGKNKGIMEGYEIEKMVLHAGDENKNIKGVVIGMSEHCISAGNVYQMILNPAVLEEKS